MLRLLFVDDEPKVLDGLRRQLFTRRSEWEFHFATSGAAALDTLQRAPFDAIVTDIRMPGMDGAALLEEVRRRYPDTIRVVLSGHSESEVATRALALAHRYLSKPCDVSALSATLDQALSLRVAVSDARMRALLHRVGDLPHAPEICSAIERELADPEPSFERIAALVTRDQALVARVLQFANSAYFAGNEQTTGIDAAVARLGTTLLRSLVMSALVRDRFTPTRLVEGFNARLEQRHAMYAATIAREIAQPAGIGDQAFTAGLLHDVGKLVLASRLPAEYADALRRVRETHTPLIQVERELLGASHADVGAYLLALWGLPPGLSDAVRRHHLPVAALHDPLDISTATIVANHLAHEREADRALVVPTADPRWDSWRQAAERLGGRT